MAELTIMQLYPRDMNIYGDWGNVQTVAKRAEWRGIDVKLVEHNPGDTFVTDIDLIVGGGGQDSGQDVVAEDLQRIGSELRAMASDGMPMLMICGMYQLFGNRFITREGHTIEGIGVIDMETRGGPERLIGNTVIRSPEFGDVIGYENHSGLTYLADGVAELGTVTLGAGNNGEDKGEGARVHEVIGSYLHGSLLPKNPRIADHLLRSALRRRNSDAVLEPLEVPFETRARETALTRPR